MIEPINLTLYKDMLTRKDQESYSLSPILFHTLLNEVKIKVGQFIETTDWRAFAVDVVEDDNRRTITCYIYDK